MPATLTPVRAASSAAIQLPVPSFCQRDSATVQGLRMCFSSTCAMAAAILKPGCLAGAGQPHDRYLARLQHHGNTIDGSAQIQTLRGLGIQAELRTDGRIEQLIAQLQLGIPIPVGWLHHGPVSAPTGGGHWSLVVGWDPASQSVLMHDPTARLIWWVAGTSPPPSGPAWACGTPRGTGEGAGWWRVLGEGGGWSWRWGMLTEPRSWIEPIQFGSVSVIRAFALAVAMPFPLTALLLALGGPQPLFIPGSVQAEITQAAIGASQWVAQRQGAALAPSLQGKPVVVDIYASWCPACRTIEPTLRSLKQQKAGKVSFVTFDVSDADQLKKSRERAKTLGLGAFLEANRSQTSLVAVIDPATGTTLQTFRANTNESAYIAAIKKAQLMLKP